MELASAGIPGIKWAQTQTKNDEDDAADQTVGAKHKRRDLTNPRAQNQDDPGVDGQFATPPKQPLVFDFPARPDRGNDLDYSAGGGPETDDEHDCRPGLIWIEEDKGAHCNAEDVLEVMNRAITSLPLYRGDERERPVHNRIDAEYQYQRGPEHIWAGPGENANVDREESAQDP